MLEDLILRELALHEPRDAELDELPAKGAPVVALGEKAVMHHLHRDRTEAFAHSQRADVSHEGTHEAAPIETVVIVEAPIFRGDERLLHVHRHLAQLDVDAPHDREAADEAAVLVDNSSAFGWMEGPDLGWRGAAGEAAGEQPRVGSEHSDRRSSEQRQSDPVAPNECSKRQLRRLAKTLPRSRYQAAGRKSHAVALSARCSRHDILTSARVPGSRWYSRIELRIIILSPIGGSTL